MHISPKTLVTFTAALLALLTSGLSHASLISFSFDGIVENPGDTCGGCTSLIPVGSTVTVTGKFDDNNAPLNGNILFSAVSGNTLSIDLREYDYTNNTNGGILTQAHDSRFDTPNGGAFLTFLNGSLTGFDYRSYNGLGDNPFGIKFTTGDLTFDNGGPTTLFGHWESTSLVLAPVPVPAAAWLFGSGLVGLAGIARRKRSA